MNTTKPRLPISFITKALRNEADHQKQSWWMILLLPFWICLFVLINSVTTTTKNKHNNNNSNNKLQLSASALSTVLQSQLSFHSSQLEFYGIIQNDEKIVQDWFSEVFVPALSGSKISCRYVMEHATCYNVDDDDDGGITSNQFNFLQRQEDSSSIEFKFPSSDQQLTNQERVYSSARNIILKKRSQKQSNSSVCNQTVDSIIVKEKNETALSFSQRLVNTYLYHHKQCSSSSSKTTRHIEMFIDNTFKVSISAEKNKISPVLRVVEQSQKDVISKVVMSVFVFLFSLVLWARVFKKVRKIIKKRRDILALLGTDDQEQKAEQQGEPSIFSSIKLGLTSTVSDFSVLSDLFIALSSLILIAMAIARSTMKTSMNNFEEIHSLQKSLHSLSGILVLTSSFRIFFDFKFLPIEHLVRTFRYSRKVFTFGALLCCLWVVLSLSVAAIGAFSNSVGVVSSLSSSSSSLSYARHFTRTFTSIFAMTTVGSFSFGLDKNKNQEQQNDGAGDINQIFLLQDHISPILAGVFIWLATGLIRFGLYSIILAIFVDAVISSPFRQVEASSEWLIKRIWCRISMLIFLAEQEKRESNSNNKDEDEDGEENENGEENGEEKKVSSAQQQNIVIRYPYLKKVWFYDALLFIKNTFSNSSTQEQENNITEDEADDYYYFAQILHREATALESSAMKKLKTMMTEEEYHEWRMSEKGKEHTQQDPLLSSKNNHSSSWKWWRSFIFEQALADRDHEMLEDERHAERFGSPLDRIVKVVFGKYKS